VGTTLTEGFVCRMGYEALCSRAHRCSSMMRSSERCEEVGTSSPLEATNELRPRLSRKSGPWHTSDGAFCNQFIGVIIINTVILRP